MSDFFDKLANKGKELLSTAKDTANDLIEKGRDKAEELKLDHELSETFAGIGKLFFEKEVNGTEPEGLEELINKAKELKAGLEALAAKAAEAAAAKAAEVKETVEEAVEEVKEAVEEAVEEEVVCPVCGAKFPKGTKVCPICGASLE
jgi:rubrerythrin